MGGDASQCGAAPLALLLVELLVHGPARPRGVLGWSALLRAPWRSSLFTWLRDTLWRSFSVPCWPEPGLLFGPRSPGRSWPRLALLTGLPFWRARAPGEGFASVGASAISVWLGRLSASRLEEVQAHRRTVSELEAAQARLAHLAETRKALAGPRPREARQRHPRLPRPRLDRHAPPGATRQRAGIEAGAAVERLDLVEASVRETLGGRAAPSRPGPPRPGRAGAPRGVRGARLRDRGGGQSGGAPHDFTPDAEGISDVSDEVSRAIYQTVQEALTNAVRHGNARRVTVDLEAAGRRLCADRRRRRRR